MPVLDFDIIPTAYGHAEWQVFDARTAETIAYGFAASYSMAEASARAEIDRRNAAAAVPVVVDIEAGAWTVTMGGLRAPLPFTAAAEPETVRKHVAERFPRRVVVLGLAALRSAA